MSTQIQVNDVTTIESEYRTRVPSDVEHVDESFDADRVTVRVGDVEIRTIGPQLYEVIVDGMKLDKVTKAAIALEVGSLPRLTVERLIYEDHKPEPSR